MMAGFALALAACVARKHWGYAAFMLVAVVETHLRLRYPFHVWARISLLGAQEEVGAKGVLQSTLLYVSGMLGCIAVLFLVPYLVRAGQGRRLMVLGSVMVAAMLVLELVSPHYVDAVIYHPVGPFALSAIVYFIGAGIIAGGALMTRRRRIAVEPLNS